VIHTIPETPNLPHCSTMFGTVLAGVAIKTKSILSGTSSRSGYAFTPKILLRLGFMGYTIPSKPEPIMLLNNPKPRLPGFADAPTIAITLGLNKLLNFLLVISFLHFYIFFQYFDNF